jgi:carboxypeptidase Taq
MTKLEYRQLGRLVSDVHCLKLIRPQFDPMPGLNDWTADLKSLIPIERDDDRRTKRGGSQLATQSYLRLEERFRKIARLSDAEAILHWDEAVMMPTGSSQWRNESLAELSHLIKELSTAPEVADDISRAEAEPLSEWQAANLREMKRRYVFSNAVPPQLHRELVTAKMESEQAWRHLRAQNNWKDFLPRFERVVRLSREELAHLSDAIQLPLYDTALTRFSPGLSDQQVSNTFADLRQYLPGLIAKITDLQTKYVFKPVSGRFSHENQKKLGRRVMEKMGFSFEHGRLDQSHHPFCGGTPKDVRITNRYNEDDFASGLMGIIHETGHGLYEMNLPIEWYGQPVGQSCGMAIHESQSLLMEMQVGRSKEFFAYVSELSCNEFANDVQDSTSLSAENLWQHVSQVKPDFIRIDADEVTYPLHVILRYEIEKDLIEGRLEPKDLPEIWNQKMMAYLGLSTLGNDRNGCMQDVHWPAGLFGYFPAYTFGAIIAAQLFAKIREQSPSVMNELSEGDFSSVRSWLQKNIWSLGSKFSTLDLIEQAAGPISATPFRTHLERRYL